MAKKDSAIDFEKALTNLEQLVESMESGELTLEQSLDAFERGVKLTRDCQQALQQAEQKVQILMARDGEAQLEPFLEDGDNDSESH